MRYFYLFLAILFIPSHLRAQTWDSPVHISDPALNNGGVIGYSGTSMITVNGNPAIAYYNYTNTSLVYMRATDANGTSWGTPVTLDADGDVGQYLCMAIVNGNPAVAYYDFLNGDLKYIIANDANGASWGTPVVVGGSNSIGRYLSLKVVNGKPAISYFDQSLTALKYTQATDATGSTWGTKITVSNSADVGYYTSLEVINGNPAIAYLDNTNDNIVYVRATDADGVTWGSQVTVAGASSLNLSQVHCKLVVVNGNPAVSFRSPTGLGYVRASDASGTTWGTAVTIEVGSLGYSGYMDIANGNPAIAYYDATNNDLKYVRASDASGGSWGTPVTPDTTGTVGFNICLAIVNGNPAISYYDATNSDLKYVRASDASGTSWGTPLSFSVGTGTGQYTGFVMANGNPAMSFYDQTNGDLKYVRASNTTGSNWGTPVSVDATGDVGQYSSAAIVNSNPAISYYDVTNGDLKYVRASDASGTTWGSPVTVDNTTNIGQYTRLVVVNGNPAIAYYDVTNGDLKYVRASDASGTTWGSPVTVTSTDNIGQYLSLSIINGNPAISYYDATGGDLEYVRAGDASGTTWGSPVTIESANNVGQYTSLGTVNGNPAISYYDVTNANLKYVRASDASGSTWGSPVTVASTDNVGGYASFSIVSGKPAIFYEEIPASPSGLYRLKYIRATDANGTTWGTAATLDAAGGAYTSVSSIDTNVYASYYSEGHQLPSFIHGSINSFNWTGGASTTNWFTTGNWEGGIVPTPTRGATIPGSLSFYPDISSGTAYCKNLVVSSGATVTISGGTLRVTDTLNNTGTITGTSGSLELTGSTAQVVIAGTNSIKNVTLNNSAGATITSGTLNITGTYTPTSGVLTTGGNLTLKSDATGTARIAAGTGTYISGNVTVEKYIPGKRVFRFFAHPFSTSMALSSLTDDIDITGSGGAANGFTTTSSNSPSSFMWNATLGNATTGGNNPGWQAFTNANGAGANAWNQYAGARILVRGSKGQGLFGGTYTPNATTIDMSGSLNQGDQVINLTKGDSTTFVMAGNPFASQVDMNLTTGRTNMGSAYYIWDATQGTKGGYTSNSFGSSYILPAYASFITTLTANGSITFPEACKSSSADAGLFKTTAAANTVQLRIEDSTIFWDRFLLRFDDTTANTLDYEDAKELYNPEISFYSFSKDDTMLSIDTRPYADSSVIQLGLYCPLQKNFRIVASEMNMPAGTKLFLKDKYLNKAEEITGAGYEYWFTVNNDTASWGDNRFELNTLGKPVTMIESRDEKAFSVKIVPNPTSGKITLYYNGALAGKELGITISNVTGMRLAQQTTIAESTGNIRISIEDYPAGIYIIELRNGSNILRHKVVRQ